MVLDTRKAPRPSLQPSNLRLRPRRSSSRLPRRSSATHPGYLRTCRRPPWTSLAVCRTSVVECLALRRVGIRCSRELLQVSGNGGGVIDGEVSSGARARVRTLRSTSGALPSRSFFERMGSCPTVRVAGPGRLPSPQTTSRDSPGPARMRAPEEGDSHALRSVAEDTPRRHGCPHPSPDQHRSRAGRRATPRGSESAASSRPATGRYCASKVPAQWSFRTGPPRSRRAGCCQYSGKAGGAALGDGSSQTSSRYAPAGATCVWVATPGAEPNASWRPLTL